MKRNWMTNGHLVTNKRWIFIGGDMNNAVILYIGFTSNSYVKYVSPDDSSKPDGWLGVYFYIANDGGIMGYKAIGIYLWNFVFKGQYWHIILGSH